MKHEFQTEKTEVRIMILSNVDRGFLDGELVIKVENEQQSRYLIGLAIIGGLSSVFTETGDYEDYPYYGVSEGELIGYSTPPMHVGVADSFNIPQIPEGKG